MIISVLRRPSKVVKSVLLVVFAVAMVAFMAILKYEPAIFTIPPASEKMDLSGTSSQAPNWWTSSFKPSKFSKNKIEGKRKPLNNGAVKTMQTTATHSCHIHDIHICGQRNANETASLTEKQAKISDEFVRQRFQQRAQLMREQCQRPEVQQMVSRIKADDEILTLANGRLEVCVIPKIGTTFTRMLEKNFLTTASDSLEQNSTAKTYFAVREPYARLVSGYIDKLVTNRMGWQLFGRPIVSLSRPNATEREIACGSGVTFPEFVKYLIYSQENLRLLDKHFQPVHQQCDFCNRHYDFVSHLETMTEDLTYILRTVKIPFLAEKTFDDSNDKALSVFRYKEIISKCADICEELKNYWWSFQARGIISKDIPLPVSGKQCRTIDKSEFLKLMVQAKEDSATTIDRSKQKRDAIVELFRQIPLEDRLRLRKLFLPDFEIFGYDPSPPDIFPECCGGMDK